MGSQASGDSAISSHFAADQLLELFKQLRSELLGSVLGMLWRARVWPLQSMASRPVAGFRASSIHASRL